MGTRLTGLIALAALIGGCGAGHHHERRASVPQRAPVALYRWLVPLRGGQPSVASENQNRGTRAWRLPGPASDVGGVARGDVSAYVSSQALAPGQAERIYVSAPGSSSVSVRIYRIGWYGGAGGREVLSSAPLPLGRQPPCDHDFRTGLTVCHWHPTLSFQIPFALPTGVYIAKLETAGGVSDCLFVVRSTHPQPLVAQLPTSTYEAYNAWGGDSLYPGGADRVGLTGTTQGVEVSYDRPYDSVTGAGEFFARDVAMVWFLERYGYPVSYTTSESVDQDPGQLLGRRAVIDFGHSEYWSQRQANAFARARNRGTSLLFLGSDTLAWRVRYTSAGHAIVAYKEHSELDPDRHDPTGSFPDGGAGLTGSAYLGCITPRLRRSGPPTYLYYAWRPARGLRPRWLFAHTGVRPSTAIPGIVGYELDMRTAAAPRAEQPLGYGAAPCMSAERGEPHPGQNQDLAQTTLYTARSGALVFSSGTLGWELGLEPVPSASPDAPRAPVRAIVQMTRNLLQRALSARAGAK